MDRDRDFMALALQEATRATRTTPNPLVGAVVVRDGNVVGKGFHPGAGSPHAEVFALREAGEAARDATLYVTLEPCRHTGRTPPCTDAILAAGIRRVVVAMEDPDPRMQGGSFALLRERGVEVEAGLLGADARSLNRPYVTVKEKGRAFFWYKWAMSLDGKTATATGESRWISGPEARERVHHLRCRMDAVMVGSGTLLADDPRLTCRLPSAADQPLRIVVDKDLRTPVSAALLQEDAPPPLIATRADALESARADALRRAGARLLPVPLASSGHLDLVALARTLPDLSVYGVLVEGGGGLGFALARAGLLDRIAAVLSPRLLGGREAPSPLAGPGFARLAEGPPIRMERVERLGEDIWIEGDLLPTGQ